MPASPVARLLMDSTVQDFFSEPKNDSSIVIDNSPEAIVDNNPRAVVNLVLVSPKVQESILKSSESMESMTEKVLLVLGQQ